MFNNIYISGLLGVGRQKNRKRKKERKEWRGRRRGDVGSTCLCRFDYEMTSDRDEISDSDSLQCGKYFCEVRFFIPWLDFIVQVGVCFS